jgi:hypothetical protein
VAFVDALAGNSRHLATRCPRRESGAFLAPGGDSRSSRAWARELPRTMVIVSQGVANRLSSACVLARFMGLAAEVGPSDQRSAVMRYKDQKHTERTAFHGPPQHPRRGKKRGALSLTAEGRIDCWHGLPPDLLLPSEPSGQLDFLGRPLAKQGEWISTFAQCDQRAGLGR